MFHFNGPFDYHFHWKVAMAADKWHRGPTFWNGIVGHVVGLRACISRQMAGLKVYLPLGKWHKGAHTWGRHVVFFSNSMQDFE